MVSVSRVLQASTAFRSPALVLSQFYFLLGLCLCHPTPVMVPAKSSRTGGYCWARLM